MGPMMADGSRNNGLHTIVTRCAEQRVAASLRMVDAFSSIVRNHVSFVAHPFAPIAPSLSVARPSNQTKVASREARTVVVHCLCMMREIEFSEPPLAKRPRELMRTTAFLSAFAIYTHTYMLVPHVRHLPVCVSCSLGGLRCARLSYNKRRATQPRQAFES